MFEELFFRDEDVCQDGDESYNTFQVGAIVVSSVLAAVSLAGSYIYYQARKRLESDAIDRENIQGAFLGTWIDVSNDFFYVNKSPEQMNEIEKSLVQTRSKWSIPLLRGGGQDNISFRNKMFLDNFSSYNPYGGVIVSPVYHDGTGLVYPSSLDDDLGLKFKADDRCGIARTKEGDNIDLRGHEKKIAKQKEFFRSLYIYYFSQEGREFPTSRDQALEHSAIKRAFDRMVWLVDDRNQYMKREVDRVKEGGGPGDGPGTSPEVSDGEVFHDASSIQR